MSDLSMSAAATYCGNQEEILVKIGEIKEELDIMDEIRNQKKTFFCTYLP